MLKLSIGLSGGGGAGGIPGLSLLLGPLRNDGTADLTVVSVPADADALRWRIDAADTPEIFAEAEADVILGPGVTATASTDGTTVTITVTAPPAYAGGSPYTVTEAALLAGPVNLVPPSVSESGGTYTATPGLWVTLASDPAVFSYEWRTGTTVWTTGDGVAVNGLSFTPTAGAVADAVNLDGLIFREYAANLADTVFEDAVGKAPAVLTLVRYSPSRVGALRTNAAIPDTRKFSVIMRVKFNSLPSSSANRQVLFGRQFNTQFLIRENGAVGFELKKDNNVAVTNGNFTTANGVMQTGVWYSFWMNADLDAGIDGNRTGQSVRNGAIFTNAPVNTTQTGNFTMAGLTLPHSFGAYSGVATPTTDPYQIADADFDLFVAYFYGTAFNASEPAVWGEVFDPLNGHAFRPEYLNGTKVTVGGVTPSVVFRGSGLVTGTNAIPGGPAWYVNGVQQEAVLA